MSAEFDFIRLHGQERDPSQHYTIVLIPGNPGLISFYGAFLRHLHVLLRKSDDIDFEVIGRSLRGFEAEPQRRIDRSKKLADSPQRTVQPPLTLSQQIDSVEDFIVSRYTEGRAEQQQIILVGHSVGAFILLEILRRFSLFPPKLKRSVRIVGGICLFPTIIDIRKSDSGRRFGWLLKLPYFSLCVALLVKIIVFILPKPLLNAAVGRFTRFPADSVSTILTFLQSPAGVRQALYMAKDEMDEITTDRWGEAIWGSSRIRPPKLFFYFGRADHWVADRTRDDLIFERAHRGGNDSEWKPRMEVDSTGIPHGFCIEHSLPVARVCHGYIDRIVGAQRLDE